MDKLAILKKGVGLNNKPKQRLSSEQALKLIKNQLGDITNIWSDIQTGNIFPDRILGWDTKVILAFFLVLSLIKLNKK